MQLKKLFDSKYNPRNSSPQTWMDVFDVPSE